MYAFRDRYAKDWGLELHPRAVPADRGDGPDAAAGRPRRRPQDAGPEGGVLKHGFNGLILGIRRDEEATRAKERVFSPRDETACGTSRTSRPSSGTST